MDIDICKDGFWIRIGRQGSRGRMSLLQRDDGGAEAVVADFEFLPGDLEQVARGISYQQASQEGHVSMREHHGQVEIEFKSRRSRQSHGCAVAAQDLVAHLERIWAET